METVRIESAQSSYDVLIGKNIFHKVKDYAKNKCLIVTDDNVAPLYLDKLKEELRDFECYSIILPNGETTKDKEYLFMIYDECVNRNFNRNDTIIALGGGVIGDLTGFAAGTYMRGVRYIAMPTTLLSMVDSSCGGKVAINHEKGKNLIGMFYQPSVVIASTDTLNTLDGRQFGCGMGEVIKYGCIKDIELFEMLKQDFDLETVIARCVKIKNEFVMEDTFDKGVRMILNFGHTFGHCIENACGYGNILHGEAVAIGMIYETMFSEYLGITQKGTYEKICEVVKKNNLPYTMPKIDNIIDIMKHDKKSFEKGVDFAFISEIGKYVSKRISFEDIKKWGEI